MTGAPRGEPTKKLRGEALRETLEKPRGEQFEETREKPREESLGEPLVEPAGKPLGEPLKLLCVNRSCHPSLGGIQTFLDTLGRRLSTQNVEVTVAATAMSSDTPMGDFPYRVFYGPTFRQMWSLLREADIVQFSVFDYNWWLAAKLLRKTTIVIFHSHARVCPKGVAWNGSEACQFSTHWRGCVGCMRQEWPLLKSCIRWASLPLKQWLTNRADAIVNISMYAESAFGVPPSRARTILMGVDRTRFQPTADPTRDYLLFVGRLIHEKGCQVLLRAYAKCVEQGMELPLVVVGDGPFRKQLEGLARELHIESRVDFRGSAHGEALVRWMQNAVAVIVPSIGPEGWSRTPMEAIGCGTPVIVASSGGLQDVGTAGLQYERMDDDALAKHLHRLTTDEDLRRELMEAATELARRFDLERMAMEYLDLYRELSGRTKRGSSTDGSA